ncbi:GntR family transcriptional regulator [Lysinibacillus pakistanensis]|uniref:GntR family transcriptional regulator n=1 Tax=Lysinibacillus pakistanensis TaxID=759811 RepID=A0AAX3WYV5_9BACI|nr:GntR family transcriptional regulator [Lysinibacillus pakistanensis]MDM5232509.1 GntR family transcriptional regulator [Lysinibacillus pakistanensis]WHY48019.1 GntR family transcriptional regulator [Lysinibacillus pakistanensis]WHY53031.1 GntR family transcriptional regulator [Lysinibacillus pakistanensis]
MNVKIDITSNTPFYQQLTQQLLLAIATGNLQYGDQLPSIRDLAGQTNLNLHTVHKSYKELQKKGVITIKPRSKAFLINENATKTQNANLLQIAMKLEQIIIEAYVLGIGEQQLKQLFQEGLRKYYTER